MTHTSAISASVTGRALSNPKLEADRHEDLRAHPLDIARVDVEPAQPREEEDPHPAPLEHGCGIVGVEVEQPRRERDLAPAQIARPVVLPFLEVDDAIDLVHQIVLRGEVAIDQRLGDAHAPRQLARAAVKARLGEILGRLLDQDAAALFGQHALRPGRRRPPCPGRPARRCRQIIAMRLHSRTLGRGVAGRNRRRDAPCGKRRGMLFIA
jgi:hypothetical protein